MECTPKPVGVDIGGYCLYKLSEGWFMESGFVICRHDSKDEAIAHVKDNLRIDAAIKKDFHNKDCVPEEIKTRSGSFFRLVCE